MAYVFCVICLKAPPFSQNVYQRVLDELKRISKLPCSIREVSLASHTVPEAGNENLRLSPPFRIVRWQRLVVVYRRFRTPCVS